MRSPLHAELLTAPNIINDGNTPNTFTIGVSNASLDADFALEAGDELHFWFIISDNPSNQIPDRPWGLTSEDFLFENTVIKTMDKGNWEISNEHDIGHYGINRPDLRGYKAVLQAGMVILQPGEYLSFTIEGLKSALPDGYTSPQFAIISRHFPHLNVRAYNNWVTISPILKSPIIIKKHAVGIGTDDPGTQFHVVSPHSTDMVLETTGGDDSWSNFNLRTKIANWQLGTAYWQNALLYLRETRSSKTYWSALKLAVSTDGKFGMGEGEDEEILPTNFRLHLLAQSDAHLHIASNVGLIEQAKEERNLIKFGKDGDFQLMYKDSGYFGHSSLGMASSKHSVGFYYIDGAESMPALEVECATGNTYIKGALRIDGLTSSQERPALEIGGYGQFAIDAPGKTAQRFVVQNNGNVGINNPHPSHQLDVAGDINLSGKPLINGDNLFTYKSFKITIPAAGGTGNRKEFWEASGYGYDDYIGIIAGYELKNAQIDSNRVINSICFREDTAGAGGLWLFVDIYYDREPDMELTVNAVFIKKGALGGLD
ncbi:MAG: hypothetical protein MI974_05085 [Chitinophagales bacterium]|nr:hypothetical protein [Chitinophagales bacterium]